MSRALLKAMSLILLESNKSIRCEAWPATVALHSQMSPSPDQSFNERIAQELGDDIPFKAVYFPHPVYFSEPHSPAELELQLNRHDFLGSEGLMTKSTYYWSSSYTDAVYRRWRLRMGNDACRMPALLHPVKLVGY
ncbi:hypothetical protein CBS101457_004990 [Exobasidium rhododendri]|nr:hypothetical protein CBS101457_004990 [Exobasidium rhododendri]